MNCSIPIATTVAVTLFLTTLPGYAAADEQRTLSTQTTSPHVTHVARADEEPVEKNALPADGHPLTSVVVTQCNLIVAVYMTMPDGRLLRFDKNTGVPSAQLMTMAYSASHSERVEVSCNDTGAAGYEKHDPI